MDALELDFKWRVTHARTGDVYGMLCLWNSEGEFYELSVGLLPPCQFPVGRGHAHITKSRLVCVAPGREPRTKAAARAVAMVFVDGFSEYRRTGQFPNGPVEVITADADG